MRASLVLLAAMVTVAYAAGQYYVPRSYYTIDSDGHETAPIPLRRLRRSVGTYPYPSGANANADAQANANAQGGGSATANAKANANARSGAGYGGYLIPAYLGSGPSVKSRSYITEKQSGLLEGHSVSASTDVGVDSAGKGYYDQAASIGN